MKTSVGYNALKVAVWLALIGGGLLAWAAHTTSVTATGVLQDSVALPLGALCLVLAGVALAIGVLQRLLWARRNRR